MATFHYRAYTRTGSIESGAIEAPSMPDAVKALSERGLYPFETAAAIAARPRLLERFDLLPRRVSLAELSEMMRELGALVRAGIAIDDALSVMMQQTARAPVRALADRLFQSVTAGALLSAAIEQHAASAPPYVAPLVRAGESRGSLGSTLTELARFLQTRVELDARIRSTLAYPLVLSATALISVIVIVSFLVPALLPLFKDARVEPPLAIWALSAMSEFAADYWFPLVVLTAVFVLLLRRELRRPKGRMALDAAKLRLPVIGSVVQASNIGILGRTLGVLLRHGVALVPALTMTAAALPNRCFSEALSAAANGVREGHRLAPQLDRMPIIPKAAVRLITIGEEASKLDELLLHLAEIAEADGQRRVERALTLLTPALTAFIGILVGGLMLAVMEAVLSVNQLALQ